MNETELTAMLERGSFLHHPDVDALVTGGTDRGRRALRRRRVGTASVAVLAAAGITTGGLLLAGGGVTATDPSLPVASVPSPQPRVERRVVDSTDNGPVEVTAELRPIATIHSEIQRALGPGASDALTGLSRRPLTRLGGDDLSWFFRFDDAEAQVSVHPVPYGCTPSGEDIAHQSGCLTTDDGVQYRTTGPWARDAAQQWGQTVVAWQHGFEIMVISTNVHEELSSDDRRTAELETTRVADQPTIAMDQLVALATSDIWFESAAD